jgi:serine/threonine-protein kinase RsbW
MTPLSLRAGAISTQLESIIYIGVRLAWSLTLKNPSCYLGSMTFKAPRSFELTIPSRLEEMQAVHELVGKAVKEYKLSDELAHWIELTISESMINAIQHGNKADPAKEATLRISSTGDSIEIIVEDQGCGFKLDKVADPTDIANLLKPSGRGILIIRSFMDEVDLSPREGGGCRLRMVKKIRGDPQ